jgi:hypothetical protein
VAVGDEQREATAGEPHKFINSGDGPLRQIDMHLNSAFETTWLEDQVRLDD